MKAQGMTAKNENDDTSRGYEADRKDVAGSDSSLLPMLIGGLVLIVLAGAVVMMFV